nr:hypothetical protein I302_05938 [Kwoniella bestiolae CBS 10118]OCF24478.1 hypothetical protein I302_05938 [Kwoniella bestiolae CBS 10118]
MDKIIRQREGSQTMKERLNEAGEKDEIVWGDQLSNRPTGNFGPGGFGGTRRL